MEFASGYVLNYDRSDDECVSDNEFECGMTLSDLDDENEDGSNTERVVTESDVSNCILNLSSHDSSKVKPVIPEKSLKSRKAVKKLSHWRRNSETRESTAGHYWRKADTNVVSVTLNKLLSLSNMHTGDAIICSQCSSVLSHISKIDEEADNKVWQCEFCGCVNLIDIAKDEKPDKPDITFMIEPAAVTSAASCSGQDSSIVVFCLDSSGSMGITTQVEGKLNLGRCHLDESLHEFVDSGEEDQRLPGQRCNITFISRLQCMQAAVKHQLDEMLKDNPTRRVALVVFDRVVTVIGDGCSDSVTVAAQNKLNMKDELIEIGQTYKLERSIKDSHKQLGTKIFKLEEGGTTALGPALAVAIGIAGQAAGSKVIICTDGKANVGLGSLEVSDNDFEALEEVEQFYTGTAENAKAHGVTVSVTTIKGTDCKLAYLGKVAEITGGQVNIVDPLKLTEEFGNILSDQIIATNVTATIILHSGLYFRHEDTVDSKVVRTIGNVTADTEITFEFGVRKRPASQGEKTEEVAGASNIPTYANINSSTELPFQLQILYTDLDGARSMRVITQSKPLTRDRQLAEADMNIGVMGTRAAQLTAGLALAGDYTKARCAALVNQRLIAKHTRTFRNTRSSYNIYVRKMQPVENQLLQVQKSERSRYGHTHSDSSDSEDDRKPSLPVKKGIKSWFNKKKKKIRSRTNECSDEIYDQIYAIKSSSTSDYVFPK